MNINKKDGGSAADMKILSQYAEIYIDEIKKEIEILNPDYIIC